MIYDHKTLTAGERIRLHVALESDDPFCLPAGERDPEPRRYGNEPAADVPAVSEQYGKPVWQQDSELSLHEPRLSHETILNYQLSRSLAYTRRQQADARGRRILWRVVWCVAWTVIVLVTLYVASAVTGWIVEALT